jgi:ubiquinone/menaquinone biosynthesis C-methylase UbiE
VTIKTATQKHIIGRYDAMCDAPEHRRYYGDSDFINFGYWEKGTRDQREACGTLMERLLSFLPTKNGTILDVACGKGETTAYLRKYYPAKKIAAINISEKQIQIARAKGRDCAFVMMDAADLGFADNSFDNIICVEAAFHFLTRERFLREARRVLRPGGSLVLSDILMTLDGERSRQSRSEENYVQDLAEYRAIWHRAGFQQVELVDATTECWEGYFWNVVRYVHRKLLMGEITREEVHQHLYHTYLHVPHMRYYLLVRGEKARLG